MTTQEHPLPNLYNNPKFEEYVNSQNYKDSNNSYKIK